MQRKVQESFFFPPRQFVKEVWSGIDMALRTPAAVGRMWISGEVFGPQPGDEEAIAIFPGFLAVPSVYLEVARKLRKATGRGVIFPRVAVNRLQSNCGHLFRSLELAVEDLNALHKVGIRRVHLDGHSLGGVQVLLIYALMRRRLKVEIGSVITTAAPYRNTPWKALQLLIRFAIGVDPTLLTPELARLRDIFEDREGMVTTISLPEDFIAPHDRCAVRGARNVVLDGKLLRHTGEAFGCRFLSHVGLVRHPRVIRMKANVINRSRRTEVRVVNAP